MNPRSLLAVVIAMLMVRPVFAAVAGGSKKGATKATASASATNPVLQVEPIDVTRAFPQYFVGSPVELIHAMFVGGPPRDEFETSAEYDKRRGEFLQPGIYPFLIAGANAVYDADNSVFVVDLSVKRAHSVDDDDQVIAFECESVLPIEQAAWIKGQTVIAKEAFGSRYNILVRNARDANRIFVPMSREKARSVKPYLRTIVLVHLEAEAARNALIRTPDDIAEGFDVFTYTAAADASARSGNYEVALTGTLVEIRVYDFRTGEVYATAKPSIDPSAAAQPSGLASAEETMPVRRKLEVATYPDVAQKARIGGLVIAEVTIGSDGVVKDVHVLKPLPFGLDAAAVDAIKASKFEPARKHGKPIESSFQVRYRFVVGTRYGVPVE